MELAVTPSLPLVSSLPLVKSLRIKVSVEMWVYNVYISAGKDIFLKVTATSWTPDCPCRHLNHCAPLEEIGNEP